MIYFFAALILLSLVIGIYVQFGPKSPDLLEGTWEITTETKLPGLYQPAVKTTTQELTKTNFLPKVSIPGYSCRLQKKRYPCHVLGNHLLWSIICEGDGMLQGSGHIKYSKDTFKGKLQMRTINDADGQKRFTATLKGRKK